MLVQATLRHLPKRWHDRKTNNNNPCVGLRRHRWHRGRVARRASAAAGLRRVLLIAPHGARIILWSIEAFGTPNRNRKGAMARRY